MSRANRSFLAALLAAQLVHACSGVRLSGNPGDGSPDRGEPEAEAVEARDIDTEEEADLPPPPVCGNGVVEPGEECEGGWMYCEGAVRCGGGYRECTDECTWGPCLEDGEFVMLAGPVRLADGPYFVRESQHSLVAAQGAARFVYMAKLDDTSSSFGYELYHEDVGWDGELLGGPVMFTPPSLMDLELPRVSGAVSLDGDPPSVFAVLFSLCRDGCPLYLNFIGDGGEAVLDPGVMLSDDSRWCEMQAAREEGFAAVYNTSSSGQHLAVIDREGEVLRDVVFQHDEERQLAQHARVAADEEGYTLFWFVILDLTQHTYELWMQRFDARGSPYTEPAHIMEEGEELKTHTFGAASTGSGFGLVIQEFVPNIGRTSDLEFAVIDGEGTTVTVPISVGTIFVEHNRTSCDDASVAWAGSEFGVAFSEPVRWDDPRHPLTKVTFKRVDADGTIIGEPVELMGGAYFHSVRVVWNGSRYGVSWSESLVNFQDSFLHFAVLGCTPPP